MAKKTAAKEKEVKAEIRVSFTFEGQAFVAEVADILEASFGKLNSYSFDEYERS